MQFPVHKLIFAIGTTVAVSSCISPTPSKPPNIVIFYTDDQPQRALGYLEDFFSTPNMDQLAKEGIVFENSFVTTSICCVSRASLLTGQHSMRHGVNSFDTPLTTEQMEQTYNGLLRKAGYRTAFLGKFAIGHPRSAPRELCLPEDQFDLWYGFTQSLSYSQMVDGEKRYVTTIMEEKAIDFIRDTPEGQPFLLTLSLPEPHGQAGPWNYRDPDFILEPPPGPPIRPGTMNQEALDQLPQAILDSRNHTSLQEYSERYETYMLTVRDYIARADLAIGRILQALDDQNIADNTVVIFTSDNGSMWGAKGLSGKWNMYEESIRVPLIIYDPRLPASAQGSRQQMALNIDIAPTILSMAGQPVPEEMQGIDLNRILANPNEQGIKDWYYKHVVETGSQGKPLPRCEGVRTEQWKYIRYIGTDPVQEELFNLHADPLEEDNLANNPEYETILVELRKRCDDLYEKAK